MVRFKLGASLALVGLALALSPVQAVAASPMTDAFVANVAANLALLDASSKMAASRSKSFDVLAYARGGALEAQSVAVALADATPSDIGRSFASAETLQTGRSVAVAGMTGRERVVEKPSALEAANGRMPATSDLQTLASLHGRNFDKMFFVTQLDALSQIESDYRTYISQGDDPAIAKLAHEQLPALMKRLEALTRI